MPKQAAEQASTVKCWAAMASPALGSEPAWAQDTQGEFSAARDADTKAAGSTSSAE